MIKTEIKERPILFNTEMVKAVLEGRKTQTRRIVKTVHSHPSIYEWGGPCQSQWFYNCIGRSGVTANCPYGKPGDRLWVREAWRVSSWHESEPIGIGYKDGNVRDEQSDGFEEGIMEWQERMWIQSGEDCEKAGMIIPEYDDVYKWPDGSDKDAPTRWRPSIHMPRWCSRINLEIKSVRVERLQKLNEADAIAEGVRKVTKDGDLFKYCVYENKDYSNVPWSEMPRKAVGCFRDLWNSINHKRGSGWVENPWVWVVEFEKI